MEKNKAKDFQYSLYSFIRDFDTMIPKKDIIKLREQYRCLKLVTDENGDWYSREKLKELEKNTNVPAEKLYYRTLIEKNYFVW